MIASLLVSLVLAGNDTSGLLVEAPSIPENRTLAVDTNGGTAAGEVSGVVSGRWQVTPRLSLLAAHADAPPPTRPARTSSRSR